LGAVPLKIGLPPDEEGNDGAACGEKVEIDAASSSSSFKGSSEMLLCPLFDVDAAAQAAQSFFLSTPASPITKDIPEKSNEMQLVKGNEGRATGRGCRGNNKEVDSLAATTTILKRVKNAASIFGDIRKVSQHPLLIRQWLSDESTLKKLAQTLFWAGAFGDGTMIKAADPVDRALEEMRKMSDFGIFQMCLEFGWPGGPRAFGLLAEDPMNHQQTTPSHVGGSSTPAVDSFPPYPPITCPPPGAKITPITLENATEKGAALLRRVFLDLPPWAWACSAKTWALSTLLPRLLQQNHKVLIFSQVMDILSILQVCLRSWGIPFLRLDGSTDVDSRQRLLDKFNRTPHLGVFLLSTKAGGLGLNLTAADTVIIHDSDWNPHADAQAVDRAHRMGQCRPVQVYRFLSKGTMDESMARLTQEKLELDRALKGKGGKGRAGGDFEASPLPVKNTAKLEKEALALALMG